MTLDWTGLVAQPVFYGRPLFVAFHWSTDHSRYQSIILSYYSVLCFYWQGGNKATTPSKAEVLSCEAERYCWGKYDCNVTRLHMYICRDTRIFLLSSQASTRNWAPGCSFTCQICCLACPAPTYKNTSPSPHLTSPRPPESQLRRLQHWATTGVSGSREGQQTSRDCTAGL